MAPLQGHLPLDYIVDSETFGPSTIGPTCKLSVVIENLREHTDLIRSRGGNLISPLWVHKGQNGGRFVDSVTNRFAAAHCGVS